MSKLYSTLYKSLTAGWNNNVFTPVDIGGSLMWARISMIDLISPLFSTYSYTQSAMIASRAPGYQHNYLSIAVTLTTYP